MDLGFILEEKLEAHGDVRDARETFTWKCQPAIDSGDVGSLLALKAGKRGIPQGVEWRWRRAERQGLSSGTLTFEKEKVKQPVRWEETQEREEKLSGGRSTNWVLCCWAASKMKENAMTPSAMQGPQAWRAQAPNHFPTGIGRGRLSSPALSGIPQHPCTRRGLCFCLFTFPKARQRANASLQP